jgi:ketosteroid isomerase-like protein
MKKRMPLVVAVACFLLAPANGQEGKPAAEDPAHEELRALRRELVEAVNKSDLEGLLGHLDPSVIVTWLNGEVSRNPEEVRAYYDRMMKGPRPIVKSITIDPTVEELTHLYGNTGVAYGHSKDHFQLTDGQDFVVPTRWSATVVKKDGKWLIANFHASTDMFDNPVLTLAVKRTALWAAVIAGVVGLILGGIGGWFLRRRAA